MILVKLAISRLIFDLFPFTKHIFFISYIDQHFAVKFGILITPGYRLLHPIIDYFFSIIQKMVPEFNMITNLIIIK